MAIVLLLLDFLLAAGSEAVLPRNSSSQQGGSCRLLIQSMLSTESPGRLEVLRANTRRFPELHVFAAVDGHDPAAVECTLHEAQLRLDGLPFYGLTLSTASDNDGAVEARWRFFTGAFPTLNAYPPVPAHPLFAAPAVVISRPVKASQPLHHYRINMALWWLNDNCNAHISCVLLA
jgi:hypothetical protein